jgi:dCTP deaminase
MVRGDRWWRHYGPHIVTDFQPGQVREEQTCPVEVGRVISYGTSSAGYDLRLWDGALQRLDRYGPDREIDPKRFERRQLADVPLKQFAGGDYYLLPEYSYALGATLETITIPRDHLGLVVGKSTYARCGLIVNTTPLEPGWTGQLVLELHNATPLPLRVYAREGIAQLLMLPIDMTPEVTYADRDGKYQGQMGITTARV